MTRSASSANAAAETPAQRRSAGHWAAKKPRASPADVFAAASSTKVDIGSAT